MAVIRKRFGDEHSTLMDEFERLSFEAHAAKLNRAMLGRSLSEPAMPRSQSRARLISMAPIPVVTQVMQGPRRGSGTGSFHKVLNKLLKILGRKRGARKQVPHAKDLLSCNAFSRSLRF